MEPIASFSGLASGVQWRDLIDQLMQVERAPATRLERKIAQAQTRSAAWLSFQNKLTGFQDAAKELADGSVFDSYSTSVTGSGFKASASDDASPGSYSVEVLQLATAEKLGGDIVSSASDALGLSGEFWLNGSRIEVAAGDTLNDVAYAINGANTGSDATGVTAGVVQAGEGYQLVLTSQRTGEAGIDLAGGDGLLQGLGLADANTSIKHATSDGATSDAFASRSIAVSTLRGLTGTTSGDVTLGSVTATIDLTKSLEDIAADINTAAAGTNVTAAVVSETVDGETLYRLDISGTTEFGDAGGVLETLGVLERGRGTVSQVVQSGTAFARASNGAVADASTSLRDLAIGGTGTGTDVDDTFTVTGTRRDGSTFSMTLTVAATADLAAGKVATLGDVAAAIQGAGGYDGAATVDVQNGRLTVTDGTGGASQLGLSIVSHNEAGGSMDFGAFDTTTVGRSREIVDGRDAAVRIDGVYSTHATNSVSGTIPGVSLTLTGQTTEPGAVTVSRDVDQVVGAVKSLVDGYNDISAFINDQFTGGEGSNKPLAGDSTLRGMKNRLLRAMQETLTTGVSGDWSRLGDLGIEVLRDGTFQFEESTLRDALASDPLAVERLFGVHGATSGSGLKYIDGSDTTVSGTYDVVVTQPATTAAVTGLGGDLGNFGFDEVEDILTITDLGSGKSYDVTLNNSLDTAQAVVDEINKQLDTPLAHEITSSALHKDELGAVADEYTTWAEIHNGADSTDAAVVAGDTITISGRRADATSFKETLTIEDPATETLGGLRNQIQNLVGADATVEISADGQFVITAGETGSSLIEVTLSSSRDTLQLSTSVSTEGRSPARIDASLVGDQVQLTHQDYGDSAGFRIEYRNAGTITQDELGLGPSGTEIRGTDIVGTIGGLAATGSGRVMTGADGTDVDGLMISVEDTFTSGSVTFSRGVGSVIEQALEPMLGTDTGSIQSIIDGLDERVGTMNDRIDEIEVRLERRREDLIRRFTAMEQAMAVAQNQSSWLMSQIGALPGSYSSNAQ